MTDHVHPHTHPHDHVHPHAPGPMLDRRAMLRAGGLGLGAILLAACRSTGSVASTTTGAGSADTIASLTTLPGFDAFADTVRAFVEGDYWLVESNGMPTHNAMVGIVSWQQQVPLPQPYTGANAWRFPTTPAMANTPISARTGLFRGAIAIAVDGVPIFNALNNRGDDAFLAGELDEWGGHSGRADDYHYHVAPLYLEEIVGAGKPIAYALDGYPIYGSTEPDGSPVATLDEYNGHVGADGTYHYHGTTTYPYINGGLVGVANATDQVEPQPITRAFREAGSPLKGAVITGFSSPSTDSYRLEYSLGGTLGAVDYTVQGSSVAFTFTAPDGTVTKETYTR
ncbi:unannotated protein [freshwater metagenome]|uniref:Unannotated protein n=1 Tax=freshwater metagenome TaxID=449393 RepID=A0A6J7QWR3_9ZZZZ